MKKSFLKKIIAISAVILITTPAAFCAPISIKQSAVKLLLAMGGVVLSSVVIFVGLIIYNKFFVGKKFGNLEKDDSLTTPDNVDDAVIFFIKKNKLK